jgi:hypothetical protein
MTQNRHRSLLRAAGAFAPNPPRPTMSIHPDPPLAGGAPALARQPLPRGVALAAPPRRSPASPSPGPPRRRRPRSIAHAPVPPRPPPPQPPLPPPLQRRPASGTAAPRLRHRPPTQGPGSTIPTRRTTSSRAAVSASHQRSPHSHLRRPRPPEPRTRQARSGLTLQRPALSGAGCPPLRLGRPPRLLIDNGILIRPPPPPPPPRVRPAPPAYLPRPGRRRPALRACSARFMKPRSRPSTTSAPARRLSFTPSRQYT